MQKSSLPCPLKSSAITTHSLRAPITNQKGTMHKCLPDSHCPWPNQKCVNHPTCRARNFLSRITCFTMKGWSYPFASQDVQIMQLTSQSMLKSSFDLVDLEIFCFVSHQQLSKTAWLAHTIRITADSSGLQYAHTFGPSTVQYTIGSTTDCRAQAKLLVTSTLSTQLFTSILLEPHCSPGDCKPVSAACWKVPLTLQFNSAKICSLMQ